MGVLGRAEPREEALALVAEAAEGHPHRRQRRHHRRERPGQRESQHRPIGHPRRRRRCRRGARPHRQDVNERRRRHPRRRRQTAPPAGDGNAGNSEGGGGGGGHHPPALQRGAVDRRDHVHNRRHGGGRATHWRRHYQLRWRRSLRRERRLGRHHPDRGHRGLAGLLDNHHHAHAGVAAALVGARVGVGPILTRS